MRRLTTLLVLLAALGATAAVSGPHLEHKLPALAEGELLWINVTLAEQLEPAELRRIGAGLEREAARRTIVAVLKDFAAREQAELLELLRTKERAGLVDDVTTLWLTNMIACRAERSVIAELLEHPAVARVETGSDRPDEFVGVAPPEPEIAWSVTKVGAPFVWDDYGYYGDGVVVAVSDTGVNYQHYDLRGHLWTNDDEVPDNGVDDDGNGYVDDYYGYYFDGAGGGDCDPLDNDGHGTHCAGSVSSDGSAGLACGVAPEARIMSLRTYMFATHQGEVSVWESWQYALDNGADVSSNSIGWNYGWNPDRATWRANAEAATAAGLTIVVAAGNDGPDPETITCPGDVPGVITVGATRDDDVIAAFSGRGPVDWSSVAPYYDYPNLIKPDVCAPGADVVSLDYADITGYAWGWNGTSMATPHVAGTAALMLEVDPGLTPAEIKTSLESYARELGDTGKDNTYGSGRINTFAGVSDFVGSPVLELLFDGYGYVDAGDGDGLVEPGETIEVHCDLYNLSLVTATGLTAELTSSSDEVTLVDGNDDLGSLGPLETARAEFTIEVDGDCPEPAGLPLSVNFHADNPYDVDREFELYVPGYGLEEDCESGLEARWRPMDNDVNTWAPNDEQALYGQYSFSPNEPGGGYQPDLDCSLVSLPFHIDDEHNVLTVWSYYQLEGGHDACKVQIRYTGDEHWTNLHTMSGTVDPQWMPRHSDLSAHEGQTAQLRLQFYSDSDDTFQGLWLDNIYVVDHEVGLDEAALGAVAGADGVLLSWDFDGEFAGLEIYRVTEAPGLGVDDEPLNERLLTAPRGDYLDRGYAPAYVFAVTEPAGNVRRLGPIQTLGTPPVEERSLLYTPYPNPSRGPLTVEFELSNADAAGNVLLALYDLAGRRVRTLSAGSLSPGRHQLSCDCSGLGSGVYLLRLQTAAGDLLRRVALVR